MTIVGDSWVGREVAEGRYTILGRIGEGSMGHIYLAHDRHLETDVVLKFPVAADRALEGAEFLARFSREIRSLVRLSHPHIVKVIDVGEWAGRPYVVLQYLEGGSLKDRMETGPRPLPPASLRDWLAPVAEALDFIHAQNHIHRDVKPGNILFDRHGNAFLGDFGIIKALTTEAEDWAGNELTAPGFLLGTPNYVAPEIVMGRPADGRVDQYALAMTVHEVLTGANCMAGPTPSATVVNQTNLVPPAPADLILGVPRRLSDAVLRGLAKDPRDRFESCAGLARAILADAPAEFIPVLFGPDDPLVPNASAATALTPRAGADFGSGSGAFASANTGMSPAPSAPRRPTARVTAAAALLVLLVVAALVWGRRPADSPAALPAPAPAPAPVPTPVEINIVYGTEKQRWLEAAAEEFQKTPRARPIKINLYGKGSVEGAQFVLNGPAPVPYHVWSPASSAYRDVFEQTWRATHARSPIFQAENLALTPMVFVMWRDRHEAFVKKYGKVTFQTIADAMGEPEGWATIAEQPDWGPFKFGHTEPTESNSGLLTLVLMAYEFSKKSHGLTRADVAAPAFQRWLRTFEDRLARPDGKLSNSTGNLMKEMVQRGPLHYDCLMVYENLAIDNLGPARDRWGELQVVYPEPNLWNEHPYYVLDVPWSSPDQRAAAEEFRRLLMSDRVQRAALQHGFRPGNLTVPLRVPGSPLVQSEPYGIKIDLKRLAEPPKADVVSTLLDSIRQGAR